MSLSRSRIGVAVGIVIVMVLSAAPGLVRGFPTPPTAVAIANPLTDDTSPVPPGTPIQFDGSSSISGTGGPLTYTWFFGDQSLALELPLVSHEFATDGIYDVTLVVQESTGMMALDTVRVFVRSPQYGSGGVNGAAIRTQPPACTGGFGGGVCGPNQNPGHSHRPNADAMREVFDAFRGQGIWLHLAYSDEIPEDDSRRSLYFAPVPGAENDFWDMKSLFFGTASPRQGIFSYTIFGHDFKLSDDSVHRGYSEGPPPDSPFGLDDFAISESYAPGDWTHRGGAFMHELGHNLGLHHDTNYVCPWWDSYRSSMRYCHITDTVGYSLVNSMTENSSCVYSYTSTSEWEVIISKMSWISRARFAYDQGPCGP